MAVRKRVLPFVVFWCLVELMKVTVWEAVAGSAQLAAAVLSFGASWVHAAPLGRGEAAGSALLAVERPHMDPEALDKALPGGLASCILVKPESLGMEDPGNLGIEDPGNFGVEDLGIP